MKICVASNSYNGAVRWSQLFESIKRREPGFSREDMLLACVDDGSPDAAAMQRVAEVYGAGAYTRFPVNRGIPAGWNECARLAWDHNCDVVVILNDDILVVDNWLGPMIHFVTQNPRVAAASWNIHWFKPEDVPDLLDNPTACCPRGYDGATQDKVFDPSRRASEMATRPSRIMCMAGCCFAIHRPMLHRIGPFDDQFTSFFEESDWGSRAAGMGYASYGGVTPYLYHEWAATFKANDVALRPGTRMEESRVRYCRKWGVDTGEPDCFRPVNRRLMPLIPAEEISWVGMDGQVRQRVVAQGEGVAG